MASDKKKEKKKTGRMTRLKEKIFPCTRKKKKAPLNENVPTLKPAIKREEVEEVEEVPVERGDNITQSDNDTVSATSGETQSYPSSPESSRKSLSIHDSALGISPCGSVDSLTAMELNFLKLNKSKSVDLHIKIPVNPKSITNICITNTKLDDQISKDRNYVYMVESRDLYGRRSSRVISTDELQSYNKTVCLANGCNF
jgi:hypothetical protein